jgi:hypothetical protein
MNRLTLCAPGNTHADIIKALGPSFGVVAEGDTLSVVVGDDQLDTARASLERFGAVEVGGVAAITPEHEPVADAAPHLAPAPPEADATPQALDIAVPSAPEPEAPAVECALYFWGAHKRFLMQRSEQFERDTADVATYTLPYTLWDGLRWGVRFTTRQPEVIGATVNTIEGTWGLYVAGAWCAGTELPPAPSAPQPVVAAPPAPGNIAPNAASNTAKPVAGKKPKK